jgi:hypothetical protein
MPAVFECPKCKGGNVNHGFNEPGVGGITTFYHSTPTGYCYNYYVGEHWFPTMEEAWMFVRPNLQPTSDPDWLAAWDAKILEHNQKKYDRLMKKWRDKH